MSAFDRYALAEALLAGNLSARWVLVDLLCDEGDFEEADFIRHTRTTREGTLDLAIRQLPCPEVVELGCEFVEHAAGDASAGLHSQLARVRRLLRREATAEQFAAACRGLAGFSTQRRAWYDQPLEVLDEAVQTLAAAVQAVAPGAQMRHSATASRRAAGVAVTATARSLRDFLQRQYRIKAKPRELDWQIKRTRQLLAQQAAAGRSR
jgi:hypothetical protein